MSPWERRVVAGLLVLGGCSVPSLESLRGDRGASIAINYTPSFKVGCIVMTAEDSANASKFVVQRLTGGELAKQASPLVWQVVRGEGWSASAKVRISAYERTCDAREVDREDLVADLTGKQYTVRLVTPDEDGDGYVATSGDQGGSDCRDSGPDGARMYPGNAEVCDDLDNNCSGVVDEGFPMESLYPDADGDGVGGVQGVYRCMPTTGWSRRSGDCDDSNREIGPDAPEVCDEVNNNCDSQVDEGFDKNWYLDEDGDGTVAAASLRVQCSQPAGYFHRPPNMAFDCHDGQSHNTPGKAEICDNLDNDCDGIADNGIPGKGDACNPSVCTGVKVCNLSTGTVECNAKPPKSFYPDRDGDGDGDSNVAAVSVCAGQAIPAGHVEGRHTDCDESDPTTYGGAQELCDALDNNCSGGVSDEPAGCGGSLKQVTGYHLVSANQDWRTVSTGGNGYPVWIAGLGGKLVLKRNASSKFESFSFGDPATPAPPDGSLPVHAKNCGNRDWLVSWVDSQGRVFLGGRDGWVTLHNGDVSLECVPGATPPRVSGTASFSITGMVGFEVGGQTHVLYLTDAGGRLIKWTLGGSPPFVVLNDPGANAVRHQGLHALREDFLLTVGGTFGSTQNRVRSFNGATGGGSTVLHSASTAVQDEFANAVWMGSDNKACAVGDVGNAWRWDGATTWTRTMAPQPSPSVAFSSVVMRYDRANPQNPGNEQCYMVDTNSTGRLRRWTPHGWAREPTLPFAAAVPLRDIAMNPTGSDFWVVGDDGRVFHYPEP